jgi:hypothetical protein
LFHQDRNNPLTIGAERWYVLPLQGGTVDLTEGGPIKLGGINYNGSTWSVAGTLTVTVVPPS